MSKTDDHRNSLLYTCAVSIIGGVFIEALYPPIWIISKLLECGGVIAMGYTAWNYSRLDKLFRNVGLGIDGSYPILKKKVHTDISTIYRYTLPCGLSLKDFDKHRDEIEQYLGHEVEIKYTYKEIQIEVFEIEVKSFYKYIPTYIEGDLPIMIGYDRRSKLISCDLADGEPHLLIAGESGSGKSTVLRAIITNLILKSEVVLHLVDLKNGAEFNIFRKSKNVKTFCRNIYETKNLLQEINAEVDRRCDLFFNSDVKDAKENNKKFKNKKLDVQVVIIDEFADLQNDKDCKVMLQYICQKARSCFIFCILSTQRPSAKIIEGEIKANVSSILGLKTLNKINSQIIIDDIGLDRLRGKGNGIFVRGGRVEIQAPYLEPDEARELIKHTYVEPPKPTTKKEVELSENDIASIFESFDNL
jgi:S-DNA-T family DNA segregation ATPase FtsK/SpoIIIE